MSLLQSILMGLIQGLTEFLPVSSSGHLALFKILFDVNTETGLLFDVMLHVGTLVAICIVYYKDIIRLVIEFIGMLIDGGYNLVTWMQKRRGKDGAYRHVIYNSYRKMVMLVIVSTIPTGIIGYVGADLVTAASEVLIVPGICLIITAALLFVCDRIPEGHKKPKQTSYANAFIIGICQGVATLPGLSRSGTTITACVLNGLDRRFAVKYSFIMSIPAILGAMVLQLKDISSEALMRTDLIHYAIGMAVAAVVGYICIKTMLVIVKKRKFKFFSIYCLIVGIVSIIGYFVTT
ncbi:undecaprenyl-diphosphate phosphatase [Eubacterium ramulus]|uniref:undecaprenyl-diphosphate phosphatase n=1 Tax=Eubacterium ramulus TaxID=39490 RepID=UPI0035224A98